MYAVLLQSVPLLNRREQQRAGIDFRVISSICLATFRLLTALSICLVYEISLFSSLSMQLLQTSAIDSGSIYAENDNQDIKLKKETIIFTGEYTKFVFQCYIYTPRSNSYK